MTAYDSVERGAADECEPLRGRRSRTFTPTQLLVACGAVCVCAIGATTVVNTHAQLASSSSPSSSSPTSSSSPSVIGRNCPIQDWVDDSLCAASPPGESARRVRRRVCPGASGTRIQTNHSRSRQASAESAESAAKTVCPRKSSSGRPEVSTSAPPRSRAAWLGTIPHSVVRKNTAASEIK